MKFKLISIGKKKAEIIVIQETPHDKVYSTRHLLYKGGKWKDKKDIVYKL